MRAIVIAMAFVGPLVCVGMPAYAASLQACEQTVEYTVQPPGADVPEALRGFSGIWIGKMDTGLCIATVVQSIKPDRQPGGGVHGDQRQCATGNFNTIACDGSREL